VVSGSGPDDTGYFQEELPKPGLHEQNPLSSAIAFAYS
jgi:hypothetical protein